MARQPKLRKKKIGKSVYWFTKAGGSETYFGDVEEVSHDEARKAFATHLHRVTEERPGSKREKSSYDTNGLDAQRTSRPNPIGDLLCATASPTMSTRGRPKSYRND